MARPGPTPDPVLPPGTVPEGTTELGIDIIKVARIAASIERFGERFSRRVLTESERRYVRKVPNSPPGFVTYRNERVVRVAPRAKS